MYLNTSIRMRGLYSGVITICFALFGDSKSKIKDVTQLCCWYQKYWFQSKTQKNDLNNSPNATSGGNYFQLLLSNMYLDVKRPPRRAPCSPLLHSFSIFRVRDRGDEKLFVTIY